MSNEFIIDNEHRKEVEEALVEFEKQTLGLPQIDKMEAPKVLSMSMEELRRKTPEELTECYIELIQYSLFIQRSINRHKCWERWGLSKLDEVAAYYLPDISPTFGFNERMLMAKNNPALCKELNSFIRNIRMRVDRLYDVPSQINKFADSIKDMKFANMRREKINDQ